MSTQNFVTKLGFNRKGYDLIESSDKKSLVLTGQSINLNENIDYVRKKIPNLDHITISNERNCLNKIEKLINNLPSSDYKNIIVFGGGSIIDISKRFFVSLKKKNSDLKLVVIPTLIGSGAESSMTSIINTPSEKIVVSDNGQMPNIVIYDTNILKNINSNEIIFGSIDALTHCLESTTSFLTNPYLNFFSIQTIEYFFKEIDFEKLVSAKSINEEDIYKFCIVSFNGGLAQNNSGAGLCHAIAHAAEALTSTRHSRCITYFLKPTLEFIEHNNNNFFKNMNLKNIDKLKHMANYCKKNIENIDLLDSLISDQHKKNELILLAKKDPCWRLFNLKGKKDNILDIN